MTIDAKIDVGCGEFKWKVQAPSETKPEPELPTLGGQECHDRHKHRDIRDNAQDSWASGGCGWMAKGKKIKVGYKEVYWGAPRLTGHSHMNYKILWKEGCKGLEEQSLEKPVDGETCYSLMRANYKSCEYKPSQYLLGAIN
jgi:hypothetical protein